MHCATCKQPITLTYEPLGLYTHDALPASEHRATPAPTEGRRVTRAARAAAREAVIAWKFPR